MFKTTDIFELWVRRKPHILFKFCTFRDYFPKPDPMLTFVRISILFLPLFFLSSCAKKITPEGTAKPSGDQQPAIPSPPCIIYKTKADYNKNVPVMLSADKSKIISYPDIKDIYYSGSLAYPTRLADGFLLDNRGIGPNVAFLNITYEAYRNLSKTPTVDELMKLILDKDPITVMFQCGYRSRYTDIEKELNEMISSGNLKNCKRLK